MWPFLEGKCGVARMSRTVQRRMKKEKIEMEGLCREGMRNAGYYREGKQEQKEWREEWEVVL